MNEQRNISLQGRSLAFRQHHRQSLRRTGGLFVAPEGTPFDARSLPYAYKNKSYNVYEVIKPISGVQSGTTAPSFWFNTQGGGTQYLLPYDVKYLLQNGYIKPIF